MYDQLTEQVKKYQYTTQVQVPTTYDNTSPTFIYQNFFNKISETAFLWYALDINKKI